MIIPLAFFYLTFAAIFTACLFPIVKNIGNKYNLLDRQDEKKAKETNLLRIGGASFLLPFLILIGLKIIWIREFSPNLNLDYFHFRIIFFGSIVAYNIGILDDIFNLNPLIRLFSQIILGSLTWLFGIRIENITFEIFNYNLNFELPILISLIISTVWIAGIINAINWMDGLDGLASGITLTAAISFLLLSTQYNNDTILITSSALAGAMLGFLKFNKNPAKIIMGDGGSYFLGYVLSLLAILSCFYRSNSVGSSDLYILLVPLLILFIPVVDMCFVIFSRLKRKASPFKGDYNHLHHRLIRIGFSESDTVKLIISISIILSSIALILEKNYFESLLMLIFVYPLCKNLKKQKK